MKVLHCITGLSGDGAQRMLLRLTGVLQQRGFSQVVVNLGSPGPLVERFEREGICVESLKMTSGIGNAAASLGRLRRIIEEHSPDILQGWMYHANVLLLGSQVFSQRRSPVVWNIRRGLDDYRELGSMTRLLIRASAYLSRQPSAIIYCSPDSRRQHENLGFKSTRGLMIENGFEVERFKPSIKVRQQFRESLGIHDDDVVVGIVGRFNIAKGHRYLFEAFELVAQEEPRVKLVCVGRGMLRTTSELHRMIEKNGLESRVELLGERGSPEEIYPGLDIYCSSSIGEGFPNAIAEAMSCGVPCVVTDTGASRELVDGVGYVVPTRSSSELAAALVAMVRKKVTERQSLGERSRQRILERFSLDTIAGRYEKIYRRVSGVAQGRGLYGSEMS